MLRVFYAELSSLSAEVEGLCLSEYRLGRLENIRVAQKRRQSIGAELLLHYAVRAVMPDAVLPFDIVRDDMGKPRFMELPLHFNLSHSAGLVACAVSDEPVGIDVESNTVYKPALARRFFTDAEQQLLLMAGDKDHEFGRLWTAKESALKLLGTGLGRALNSVDASCPGMALLIPEDERLTIEHKYLNGCHISVCTAAKHKNFQYKYVDFTKIQAIT